MPKAFSAVVRADGADGGRGSVDVPFAGSELGLDSRGGGPLRVKGTLNGQPLRARLVPQADGSHRLVLPRWLMARAKCFVGDAVRVELEPDAHAGPLGPARRGSGRPPGPGSRRPLA